MFDSFTTQKYRNGKPDSLETKGLGNAPQADSSGIDVKSKILIISGPTAVGKTDFVNYLAKNLKCKISIINADMGQFYTPISIGTAKPEDVNDMSLFNIIDKPIDFTVNVFREKILSCLNKAWDLNELPILVGGSGFYIKSLFYSLFNIDNESENIAKFTNASTEELFEQLKIIDKERSEKIHRNDRYRIERALALWEKTSCKPSDLKPKYNPIGKCFYYFLNKDRKKLNERIQERTSLMLDAGWIGEVEKLDQEWKLFLLRKKLIGYPEIIRYLEHKENDKLSLINTIVQKTISYAKRQVTFWRGLKHELLNSDPDKKFIKDIQELDVENSFEDLKKIIEKSINEN